MAFQMHPLCTRSRPFETVKDLKGLAVSPERAILTAVYGHGAGRILQGPPFSKPPLQSFVPPEAGPLGHIVETLAGGL